MIRCECGFYDRDRPHSAVGGGNCDHVTRRRLGKMCQCLDYCERKDPHSKTPDGECQEKSGSGAMSREKAAAMSEGQE